MFIIRADGNSDIGMGHIMRCLSIADAMKQIGIAPLFVTACEECMPIIQKRGFQVRLLSADYRDMLSELPQFTEVLSEYDQQPGKPVVLVDSYQVSREYFAELGKLAYTACLEDMGQSYPVKLLINYNIYGPSLEPAYREAENALLGLSYMPLRREFIDNLSYRVRDKVLDVMITTGGSDPFFAVQSFLNAFLAQDALNKAKIRYHVISGPFNSRAKELKENYQGNNKVVIYENVKSMKEIMSQCDVLLTAAGSTIYEACAIGIPMISFYFAENQRRGAEEIDRVTSIVNCGDFSKKPIETVERAVEVLVRCVQDKAYRLLLHQEEKMLVDGRGALKIAEALMKIGSGVS